MRRAISCQVLLVGLLFAAVGQPASAGDRKEWVKLTDRHCGEGKDNDGDSFPVHAADKEFAARLSYVDAPETNLRQGERTHQQSLHFALQLDETRTAGR